jgi:hypothetical protein
VNGKKICVEGDERLVSVPTQYLSGAFTIPGTNSLGDSDWVLRLVVP